MIKNKKVITSLIVIIILSVLSFVFIATRHKNTASVSKNLNNVASNDQINFFDPTKPPLVNFKKGRDLLGEYSDYNGLNGQKNLSADAKNYHDLQERVLFAARAITHPLNGSLLGIKDNTALLHVGGENHPEYASPPPSTAYVVDIKAFVVTDKVEQITAGPVVLDEERVLFIRDHDIFSYKLGAQKFIQVPHSNEIPENEVYQFSQGVIPDDSSLSFDGKNFTIRRCVLARTVTEKEVCTLQSLEFPN